MQRPISNPQSDILVISDYPVKVEIENDLPFSAASNIGTLNDLKHLAGISQFARENGEVIQKVQCTYLTYERPEFDFLPDFSYKPEEGFVKIPWENKVWVAPNLWTEVNTLIEEIKRVKPKIIILSGKWSFYFLSGRVAYNKTQGTKKDKRPLGAISTHRASITGFHSSWGINDVIIYPVLPQTEKWRSVNGQQVKTAKAFTLMKWDFQKLGEIYASLIDQSKTTSDFLNQSIRVILGLSLPDVSNFCRELQQELERSRVKVSVDIETRQGTIDCIGLAWKVDEGICIPFSSIENPVIWGFEEEVELVSLLREVLTHPNVEIIGQNYSYDSQYIRKFWLLDRAAKHDTMICNHVLFNTLKKDLATLASVFCLQYQYWKDETRFTKQDA